MTEIDLTGLSRLDRTLAYFSATMNFFHAGWGDNDFLNGLQGEIFLYPPMVPLRPHWIKAWETNAARHQLGVFPSPYQHDQFPKECDTARLEFVLPKSGPQRPPVCVHFAATGDTGFQRRREMLAIPLAKRGVASVLLENPFYGERRPKAQNGFSPRVFADLCHMAQATVAEGLALLDWLKSDGFQKRCVTGISMGGYVTSLVAAQSPDEIACVPCLAPHSGTPVFTQGVLTKACNWAALTSDRTHADAIDFMRSIFDQSDIRRFSPPRRPQAAIIVAGRFDAYIPPYSPQITHTHWRNSEIVWLDTGHVGAFFLQRRRFLEAILSALDRL